MKFLATAAVITIAMGSPAIAQDAAGPMPLPVQHRSEGNAIMPAGTEITLRVNEEVSTSGDTWEEGDTFSLVVASDVMLGQFIVIPAGSPAQGRITWLTSRGMFGKSGKMDIELEHIEVSGRQIAIDGTFRQEGEGATLATLGGVLVAGIFGGFVTGRSARIPNGRELRATLELPLELAILASEVDYVMPGTEVDTEWNNYLPLVPAGLTPSARSMYAMRLRDEAVAAAQANADGQVPIVAPEE